MTESELLQYHLDQRDRWARKTWGERIASIQLPVLGERANVFAAHVASMVIHPDMQAFADTMTQRFGPFVRVHHFIADWITAFLIVRYGEESRGYDPDEIAAAAAEVRVLPVENPDDIAVTVPAPRAPRCSTDPNFHGWPTAFTVDDHQRAEQLLRNHKWPESLVLLTPPPVAEVPE
jgi:hypothetical protein